MGFYIEELPTELNGITMQEADYLADEFLKDEPCNRMWDAIRALRDFYETVISEAVEVKDTADAPQTEEKHAICNGCVYCDLPNAFHPCASCVDFSKYVGEVSGDTPQTETQTETQNSNLTFEKADTPQTD